MPTVIPLASRVIQLETGSLNESRWPDLPPYSWRKLWLPLCPLLPLIVTWQAPAKDGPACLASSAYGTGARKSPRVPQTALRILAWMSARPLGPGDPQLFSATKRTTQVLVAFTVISLFPRILCVGDCCPCWLSRLAPAARWQVWLPMWSSLCISLQSGSQMGEQSLKVGGFFLRSVLTVTVVGENLFMCTL